VAVPLTLNEICGVLESQARGINAPFDFKLWLSIFAALSSLSGVSQRETRTAAVEALFGILKEHGALFSESDWHMILGGTVYPIFENILCDLGQLAGESFSGESAMANSQREYQLALLSQAMQYTISIFAQYFALVHEQLKELMEVFVSCGKRSDEGVVRLGFTMLLELLMRLDREGYATADVWNMMEVRVRTLVEELKMSVINGYHRPIGTEEVSPPFVPLQSICKSVGAILCASSVPLSVTCSFSAILREVFSLSVDELNSETLRQTTSSSSLLGLVAVEQAACQAYAECFVALGTPEEQLFFFRTLRVMITRVICTHPRSTCLEGAEQTAMAVTVTDILNSAMSLEDEEFSVLLQVCFDELCGLIPLCHHDISSAIGKLMLRARPFM
jgi:hypothetical protein